MGAAAVVPLFGVQLPHYGPATEHMGIRAAVEAVVEAGFDGIWASDHVVLVEGAESRYPYAASGDYGFPPDTPWYEALTTLAFVAATAPGLELGTSVCVLPQREPLLLAKQAVTVDRLSGGKLLLGVGLGWLREEFRALGAPFEGRGARTDAWLRLLRECWTGSPEPGRYDGVVVERGVRCEPTPVNGRIPLLIGGNSAAALRRVARLGDGWLGAVPTAGMSGSEFSGLVDVLHRACEAEGRDPDSVEISLRLAPHPKDLVGPELRRQLAEYASLGARRFTFDLSWRNADVARTRLEALASTVAEVREEAA